MQTPADATYLTTHDIITREKNEPSLFKVRPFVRFPGTMKKVSGCYQVNNKRKTQTGPRRGETKSFSKVERKWLRNLRARYSSRM